LCFVEATSTLTERRRAGRSRATHLFTHLEHIETRLIDFVGERNLARDFDLLLFLVKVFLDFALALLNQTSLFNGKIFLGL
jgi:hypothetical protein